MEIIRVSSIHDCHDIDHLYLDAIFGYVYHIIDIDNSKILLIEAHYNEKPTVYCVLNNQLMLVSQGTDKILMHSVSRSFDMFFNKYVSIREIEVLKVGTYLVGMPNICARTYLIRLSL